jgi:methionine sulfoxide reductase heme-binding subunit
MAESLLLTVVPSPHDAGLRQLAALSARIAYLLMCLTLCWGVLVSTGWVYRISGRQATRSSHLVFATLTLAFGAMHAMVFLFTVDVHFDPVTLTVPLAEGGLIGHAMGIAGLELMLAIALSAAVQRFFAYRRWLWFHRLAYPAVALAGLHAVFGAMVDGHLDTLWLAGLLVAAPALLVTSVRFVPPGVLTMLGLVAEGV